MTAFDLEAWLRSLPAGSEFVIDVRAHRFEASAWFPSSVDGGREATYTEARGASLAKVLDTLALRSRRALTRAEEDTPEAAAERSAKAKRASKAKRPRLVLVPPAAKNAS